MACDIRNRGQEMELRANQWEQCNSFCNPMVLERARYVHRKRVKKKEKYKVTVYKMKIK
jgi:hypothetical protein